jgi:trimethylamine--corrinoid protein Co-methyltransferase
MTTLLAAMGGSIYVHHAAGMLNCMITVAHEQFVIDDEIIGLCCKVLAGIPTIRSLWRWRSSTLQRGVKIS